MVSTWMPRAASSERNRTLMASVKAFSGWPFARRPPASSPPWAASSTTTNRGCGATGTGGTRGAGGACAAAHDPAATTTARVELIQRIDSQAAQQFWEKVGGLLRHNLAGKSHFPQLLHGHRVGEESNVRFAAANLFHRFPRISQIANIGLLADHFGVPTKELVQHNGVQLGQIQLPLALRQTGKGGGHRFRLRPQQHRSGAGHGHKSRAILLAQNLNVVGPPGGLQCFYLKNPPGGA